MLAVLYLLLGTLVGYHLLHLGIPRMMTILRERNPAAPPLNIGLWMLALPGGFLIGTMLITWVAYLGAYFSPFRSSPLTFGNGVAFIVFGLLAVILAKASPHKAPSFTIPSWNTLRVFMTQHRWELAYSLLSLALSSFFMYYTFYISNNVIHIGGWVMSDFGPHLGMIRSFSEGSNFPTEYPHFGGDHIRIYFMFHFLAGNLEFLGLRLDHAFNIPTILSLTAFWMLVYCFIAAITHSRIVPWLTLLLVVLRSSSALWLHLKDTSFLYINDIGPEPLDSILHNLISINVWLGKTSAEAWGQWSFPNNWTNQRHNPFAWGFLVIALLYTLPLFQKMMEALHHKTIALSWPDKLKTTIRELFLTRDAWQPASWKGSVVMGLLIGALCFWHGAVMMVILLMLFTLALASKHKGEFIVIAAAAVTLALAQKAFFIPSGESGFQPHWQIGFLASPRTLEGIATYYFQAFGLLPLAIALGALAMPKGSRWLLLCFLTPVIVANLIQFSMDMMNNHKLIHISLILLYSAAACLIYRLFRTKNLILQATSILLTVQLTITGIVDAFSFLNINRNYQRINISDPFMQWALHHTEPDALFLTNNFVSHPLLIAGRKLFLGWIYYPEAAGHNVRPREKASWEIYGAQDIGTLKRLLRENHIDYVIIEDGNRGRSEYTVNEALFEANFPRVFENKQSRFYVYKTTETVQ